MGVLVVANFERERAISLERFELIQVLANEAAGAFEAAHVFQKEQRRARHLVLLNEIGRKATSVLNPKELLPDICLQVRNAFGYDLARIELDGPPRQGKGTGGRGRSWLWEPTHRQAQPFG